MNMFMLLDEAASTATGSPATSTSSWISLIVTFAIVGLLFYFFMYRPQKKQEKKDRELKNSLQVGDEVTTIGGIVGRVVRVKEESFVLETSKDRTKITFLRSALRSIDVKADAPAEDTTPAVEADTKGIEPVELKEDKK